MDLNDFGGFGLQGYRSFNGSELQVIGPMQKIHLVVGQNNTGKSNVLHFAHDTLQRFREGINQDTKIFYPEALDEPRGGATKKLIALAVSRQKIYASLEENTVKLLKHLFETEAFTRGTAEYIWFEFEDTRNQYQRLTLSKAQLTSGLSQSNGKMNESVISQISLTMATRAGDLNENINNIITLLAPWSMIPVMHWVDTHRVITADPNNSGLGTSTGAGLVDALASLQSPEFENHAADTKKWQSLGNFIKAILDDPTASIQIPNSRQSILVSTSTHEPMPLNKLSTGIGQLIILAAVATTINGKLICLEEPELHLHPTLQRLLINYLNSNTDNHYLISTHSASLLNSELASITHILKLERWSSAESIKSHQSLSLAVADLGNKASDLVQSNYIVWVEGPSDRIYISHWLKQYDADLIEGAHYSIMFYGGALLSHLAADDEQTDEFINLLRINRNITMVIDSDKKSVKADLNNTKNRIIQEICAFEGQVWVTAGYTIENYLPNNSIQNAIDELYPEKSYVAPKHQYESPIGKVFKDTNSKPSKVVIAKNLVDKVIPIDDLQYDAKEHIIQLSTRIRIANGLKTF